MIMSVSEKWNNIIFVHVFMLSMLIFFGSQIILLLKVSRLHLCTNQSYFQETVGGRNSIILKYLEINSNTERQYNMSIKVVKRQPYKKDTVFFSLLSLKIICFFLSTTNSQKQRLVNSRKNSTQLIHSIHFQSLFSML